MAVSVDSDVSNRGATDTKFKGRAAFSWGSLNPIPAEKGNAARAGGGCMDRSAGLAGLGTQTV